MRILIGCERSGIIRTAFKNAGHDAFSCDLKETLIPGNHIKDDVLNHLNDGWDMAIFHPECKFLSYAGTSVFKKPGRDRKIIEAIEFFTKLLYCEIPKICVENPVGLIIHFHQYDQIIHPCYFGDPHKKRTLLWLKNLPPLIHSCYNIPPTLRLELSGKKRNFTDYQWSGFNRSISFPGIAKAMANQWG